jgi:hypothetical protein
MKRMMAISLFALTCVVASRGADARTLQGHSQTIQYEDFRQRGACNVNGVVYPVSEDYRVWGHDEINRWFVIGTVTLFHHRWIFHGIRGEQFEVACW